MRIDRHEIVLRFTAFIGLREYIDSRHLAAIGSPSTDGNSDLVRGCQPNLPDHVALWRPGRFVFWFSRRDPIPQLRHHFVTKLRWIGNLPIRLGHRDQFQIGQRQFLDLLGVFP